MKLRRYYVLLYEEWAQFVCLVWYSIYTMYERCVNTQGLCWSYLRYHSLGNDSLVNFITVVSQPSDVRSKIQEHQANRNLTSFRVMFWRARIQNFLVILFVSYEISQTVIFLFLSWVQKREQVRPLILDMEKLRQKEIRQLYLHKERGK